MRTVKTFTPGKGTRERQPRFVRPDGLPSQDSAGKREGSLRVVPETGELEWSDGVNVRRRGGEVVKRG